MKKTLHKSLALTLTLCMLLTLLPTAAFAVGGDGELSISDGTVDADYSVSDGVVSILTSTAMTVSGTTSTERIVVGSGVTANLTFNEVSITKEAGSTPVTVEAGGTLNLTLTGGNALKVNDASSTATSALKVESGASLLLGGTGSLSAVGTTSNYGAGIGNAYEVTGTIHITGGTISAVGGLAGIGGTSADVTISGGTVTAKGVTNKGMGIDGSSIAISGAATVVNAYGLSSGIGDSYANTAETINITGGTVTAWSACTIGVAPDYAVTYNGSYLSDSEWGIGGASGTISITGGSVDARGYNLGIGGSGVTSIAIGGSAVVNSVATVNSGGIGIGGNLETGTVRTITISGSAVVGAWGSWDASNQFMGGSAIGGGDNSGSTITIEDDAVVKAASVIGSIGYDYDSDTGYAGGTVQILDSASVQNPDITYLDSVEHIGGATVNSGIGGAGGNITINTTGTVSAATIGGGDGENGGAGGTIAVQNGTVLTSHIGGGDGNGYSSSDYSATGTGGAGGSITISGGTVGGYSGGAQTPQGSTDKYVGSGANAHYYSAAGIGGGGGTFKGGSGGTITITGGTVYAAAGVTVYDSATGDTASSGDGVGGAGIGGGNGADGGTISISGGKVSVGEVSVYPYGATSATAVPALIGGGSAGGAGEITISGGYVIASVSPYNAPVYGSGSTVLGKGMGATDAGGWVKVTGGTLSVPPNKYADPSSSTTPNPQPSPWPTAADGSTSVYLATFGLNQYEVTSWPDGLDLSGCEITSMVLKAKSTGLPYAYGTQDLVNSGYIWLPASTTGALYDITLQVKKDNTVYSFSGTVTYSDNSNIIGDKIGSTQLTYGGEVIETLQLTSDWGTEVKIYNGSDQKPTFIVKNTGGDTLTADTHYTLKIEYASGSGWTTVTEMKNAGEYRVTATGKAGTDYAGMSATSDEFFINPKEITSTLSTPAAFTKQYDGTTTVYQDNSEVESLELTIELADLCSGDVVTDIVAENPRYAASGVGTGISIEANSPSYTYTQNSQPSTIHNYSITLPALTGDITVKVIGETNLSAAGVTVTKVYDGTATCALSNVSGSVTLVNLVGSEVATVNITGVSPFDSEAAGTGRTVTLTIGSLTGTNSANYTLAGGTTTVEITNARILPADYSFTLTQAQQAQEFTQGGGLSQINLPDDADGVNGERVDGTVTLWHDEACAANQATDASVNEFDVGTHSLYVKFVPASSQTNYNTAKITTGKVVVLTVVEGAPQNVSFATPDTMNKTYGDAPFTNTATNASDGTNTPTYSSNNTDVATVNSTTGEVTVIAAGTATITATVPEVEGQYRETSVNYILTVGKKDVSVAAADSTRKFGVANPTFTLEDPSAVLVSGDSESDLAVTLTTTATQTSNVGGYSITGTSTSANYNVTVNAGTLTITKADAPNLNAINKNLLYSAAHTDVAVNVTGLPTDCGTVSFAAGTVTGDTSIIDGTINNTAGGIQFSTNIGTENQTVTIPVTVTMQNYADASVNVIVALLNKTPVTITGVSVANKTYDGAAAAYTGTPANEQGYTGTYEYVWSSGSAPKDAGNYTLLVKIPEDNASYMGETEISFTISPRALTIKPQNVSIYNGASLPSAFTLEYVGLVSGDTITPSGTPVYELKNGDSSLTSSSTNGTYTIAWSNKDSVAIANTNYTITKADGTLTISSQPVYSGGGTTAPTSTTPTVSGSTATTTVTPTVKNGAATASVNASQVTSAIDAAKAAAAKSGEKPTVEIALSEAAGADKTTASIPKSSVQALVAGGIDTLTVSGPVATVSFDAAALSTINSASTGDVSVTAAQVAASTLPAAAQSLVGDRPVYDFSVTSGGKAIASFGGTVTVSIPYTPAAGEDTDNLVVYYISDSGSVERIENARYVAATGTMIFTTTHFSSYAVGYLNVLFSDVQPGAWYYDAVNFIAEKGITSGTGDGKFSPDVMLTRGQFLTMLLRAYGITADENPTDNFSDAGNTYYTGYLAAAKRLGISDGIGNNKFAPEQAITRQEMFTLLYNALKVLDKLPSGDTGKALSDFADSGAVASWAQEAMTALVKSGTVSGDGGKLAPAATTTRAQMAQVLYNLLDK